MLSGVFLVPDNANKTSVKNPAYYNINTAVQPFLHCSPAIDNQLSVSFLYITQCNQQSNFNADMLNLN